ncbi:hypothetical protein ACN42_g3350 [Penicillium freii]|uniref:Azaphilone pigments biosynthesis cluster protein L N-terminal domain-containing protein n=1 Tax=Penicillium freii TaxID=48697 RepID=A0A101MND0_PENFR|nr:hypothetical protein ACN42_g3350 [Penicillium freii]
MQNLEIRYLLYDTYTKVISQLKRTCWSGAEQYVCSALLLLFSLRIGHQTPIFLLLIVTYFLVDMAEAIGIASGAITFATVVVQVGQSILTLKNCWDEMRDAPEDIRKLVGEIELLGLILADIEDDLSQDSIYSALEDNKHALKSFKLCKDAADDLDAICMDLSRDGHSSSRMRRSYKVLKIVMQNGNIEKYRSRLQNIIQLLTLSQQCYTRCVGNA